MFLFSNINTVLEYYNDIKDEGPQKGIQPGQQKCFKKFQQVFKGYLCYPFKLHLNFS